MRPTIDGGRAPAPVGGQDPPRHAHCSTRAQRQDEDREPIP
jgi:hypothetical protein